jgi:hypothetical protein
MDLAILRLKIRDETDIEKLRSMAQLLTTVNDSSGAGYCVVSEYNPKYSMYSGSRENCFAYIAGYEQHGRWPDHKLCICVDTPSHTIVIPEERFGESLA